jgi:hypothetical protein
MSAEAVEAPLSDRSPLTEPEPPGRRDRFLPVAAWGSMATVVLGVQFLATRGQGAPSGRSLGSWLFSGWVQFDGPEYLQIAQEGYRSRQLVWFPAYPLTVRAVDAVLGDPIVAAVLVSLAGGCVAAVLFWRWLGLRVTSRTARLSGLAVLLCYPYGWFLYGVVYSDAVFLAFVLGAFVLVERDRYLLAGLVGAFATATRPSGFAVVAGLLVLSLERSGVLTTGRSRTPSWVSALRLPTRIDLSGLRRGPLLSLLSVTGLAAFCAYQWSAWGDPLRFIAEQANYHDPNPSSLLKVQFFDAWYDGFAFSHLASTTSQAVLLTVVLMSVPAIGRRFGWGYAVYTLGLAALPAVSVSTFMGVGRYLLPAFPCFALLGEWLALHRRARLVWFVLAVAALLTMSAGFARSWYLT